MNELVKLLFSTENYELWDFRFLSSNPNITWDIVKENPDLPWNYNYLSCNPNITWDIVRANPDIHWNYYWLSSDPNITWEIVKSNSNIPWNYGYLSVNPNITWEIVKNNPDKPWDYNDLSGNPNIKENPNKYWNYKSLSQNKFKHDKGLQHVHIQKMKRLREQTKHLRSSRINIYKLYCLSKNREFIEWYYHPQNIGGKVAKKRLEQFVNNCF